MSTTTGIEWTSSTWNPVTGCTKVSPGCKHCYAETIAERFWAKQYPPVPSGRVLDFRARRFTDVQTHADRLDQPLRWRSPKRVFVNSMSDLFHEDVPEDFIFAVFQRMGAAFWHTYQILTKRPERALAVLPRISDRLHAEGRRRSEWWRHVWLGVSVENQETADERIPLLLQTPAAVRFVSAEPLLGPVDLRPYLPARIQTNGWNGPEHWHTLPAVGGSRGLDWVIVGGESGRGARPMDLAWARSILGQCRAAGIPAFFKQMGSNPVDSHYGPFRPRDRKGGDMTEFPEDLRVREFPA